MNPFEIRLALIEQARNILQSEVDAINQMAYQENEMMNRIDSFNSSTIDLTHINEDDVIKLAEKLNKFITKG